MSAEPICRGRGRHIAHNTAHAHRIRTLRAEPAWPGLFTKIIQGTIPSCKVARGETWYAFLDINPRRAGHTLVVPIEEKQRIVDLSPASRVGLLEGIADVQRRLSTVFGTKDFQVSCHDGPLAGQVPSAHSRTNPDGFSCSFRSHSYTT